MSDDSVERKEIPSEVGPIVEAAIDKIYNMLLPNDPDARQRVAALIRSYIDGKYPPTPESFLMVGSAAANIALPILRGEMDLGALRGVVHDQINFAKAQTINIVDSVLKGEMDLEATKEKARSFLNVMGGFFPPTTPQGQKSYTKDMYLFLYDEYCGKQGMSKAEFVRRIIKLNKMGVSKAERRGIHGTDFNNVYRCLNEFLKERRSKAD